MDLSMIHHGVDASKQHIRQMTNFFPRQAHSSCVCVRFDEFFVTHPRITNPEYIPRIVWTHLKKLVVDPCQLTVCIFRYSWGGGHW